MMAANRILVRPSEISDVYALAANLRQADAAEVISLGVDPRHGLRNNFRHAILRKTLFVDGELAAMCGLCGSMLGDIGYPFTMTTPVIERAPITFVKLYKAMVAEMLEHKMRLEGYVAAEYTGACRLLECVGFTLELPKPFGSHGALFREFSLVRG